MATKILLETDTEIQYRDHRSSAMLAAGGLGLLSLFFLCAGANLYAFIQSLSEGMDLWTFVATTLPSGLISIAIMAGLVWNLSKKAVRITVHRDEGRLDVMEQSLTLTGQVKERQLAEFSLSNSPLVSFEQQGNTWVVNIASQDTGIITLYSGGDQHLARHLANILTIFCNQQQRELN